jgi:hypothetical protein
MKFGFPALVFVVAVVACTDLASALDASLVSAEASSRQEASQLSQSRNVAASAACREVDVALDEGYEISSHETRYQCDERVP